MPAPVQEAAPAVPVQVGGQPLPRRRRGPSAPARSQDAGASHGLPPVLRDADEPVFTPVHPDLLRRVLDGLKRMG